MQQIDIMSFLMKGGSHLDMRSNATAFSHAFFFCLFDKINSIVLIRLLSRRQTSVLALISWEKRKTLFTSFTI
jgi:hypothetical protein